MRKSDVRDYLLEFGENELSMKSVPRELEIRPKPELINAITGPRRAGKTFYFYQKIREFGKENSLYLNFEDTRLMGVNFGDVREILRLHYEIAGKEPRYVLMDEIQNIDGWERGVRDIYEMQKYRILLTGSSSKLLSREIATRLRGRSIGYVLLPFSFKEFLTAGEFEVSTDVSGQKEAKIKNMLTEYLKYGGFPQVVFEDEMKDRILSEFTETMLYRDVVERHGIKSIGLAKILLAQMLSSYGREFSINSMYNFLKSQGMKAAKDTVYSYTSYFLDSFSVFFLNRYSEKPKLRESWPKKIYLSDTGFARTTGKKFEIGRLMENAVFLQLKRLQNRYDIEISYYMGSGGEVDFVLTRHGSIEALIQVSYDMDDPAVRKREISPLIKASERLRTKRLYIITWDEKGSETMDGIEIQVIPLWEFLLTDILGDRAKNR